MTNRTEYVPGELSQAEKRATLENDRRVREQQQGSTFSSFAEAFLNEERGGRFQAINQPTHTAATPVYPEQPPNSPFHVDPVPDEPPLGIDVNAMEPVGTEKEIQASIERLGDAALPSGAPDGGAAEAPASSSSTSLVDVVESAAPTTPKQRRTQTNKRRR